MNMASKRTASWTPEPEAFTVIYSLFSIVYLWHHPRRVDNTCAFESEEQHAY